MVFISLMNPIDWGRSPKGQRKYSKLSDKLQHLVGIAPSEQVDMH